ncbi:transcriptional regulator, TetR family [Paraburkholderia phenazinium]|uniref:Transcriptional regulator, TetR family n=1 Tax=Paraburkholderia phenazinium TaxID=60549 RepID=A0A1N6ITB6_9BURK|nr:transcriptional regulator, TetR family [Paraburkholderia phenazinium]
MSEAIASCTVRFMERKDELIAKALDYFLEHGVADLSLRPLAAQIGSSSRLLIYHFGTKDELITTVMDEARLRIQQSFAAMMSEGGKVNGMKTFWEWAVAPQNSPYMRLFFEVQMLAMQNPAAYARYVERNASSWQSMIENALPPTPDRRAVATLCGAVMDGLTLEFLNSGDLGRTTEALDIFGSMLKQHLGRTA